MMPPVFAVLSASTPVTVLLGSPPNMRLFPFGEANQDTVKPYATWQLISGIPSNYINQLPDVDDFRIQIDIWAATMASALSVAQAIRDAVEPHAHIVNAGNATRDTETRTYRYMIDAEFFTER